MTEPDPRDPAPLPGSDRSEAPTTTVDRGTVPSDTPGAPLLKPGQRFGPYGIVRLLGRGGMGEVYDAEELDSGRRVAIKLLNRPLGSRAERERFLREGRLAAGVSHPHCVYVFGTDEIQGLPVISMELASGGTLKDVVKHRGPLPFREAVDAILQVVAGLEAAAAAGVLHRDIKPANCFVDDNGTVKVGDFGLSTSTLVRDETHLTLAGTIMGTPAYASPEQMRAEALDLRSDIYSVGATLYYLLTGRAPFDEANIVRLVALVVQEMPPDPRTLGREIPTGLAALVMRALAKRPGDRFEDYAALRAALEPFGMLAPLPAPPLLRAVAGSIDWLIYLVSAVLLSSWLLTQAGPANRGVQVGLGMVRVTVGGIATFAALVLSLAVALPLFIGYYAVLEWFWGASLGKRLCGLRVADVNGHGLSFRTSAWRTTAFVGILYACESVLVAVSTSLPFFAVPLLFATARRRNGYAGLHDLLSGSRVVAKRGASTRASANAPDAGTAVPAAARRIGPYRCLDEAGPAGQGLIVAYDPVLHRRVWIRVSPERAPPVPAARRDAGRPTRLRWLGGRRATGENWDAFESVEGQSFPAAVASPQPWSTVRHWLADLAVEIHAGLQDGSLMPLALDDVWIGADGRARLLDPPPSGEPAGMAAPAERVTPDMQSVQRWLHLVAVSALDGAAGQPPGANGGLRGGVLPLSASALLRDLADRKVTSSQVLTERALTLLDTPACVSQGRRLAHLALCGAVPAFVAVVLLVGSLLTSTNWSTASMQACDPFVVSRVLLRLEQDRSLRNIAKLSDAFDVNLATCLEESGRANPARAGTASDPWTAASLRDRVRKVQAASLRPSNTQVDRARALLAPLLAAADRPFQVLERANRWRQWRRVVGLLGWFAAIAVLSAALGRNAVLRALGVTVVTHDAREASRLRCTIRALVAWSPVALLTAACEMTASAGLSGQARTGISENAAILGMGLSAALFLCGSAWAALQPARGLQDRIAGTFLVPR